MSTHRDLITCKGMEFECELGFHVQEQGILQKIKVDLVAEVEPLKPHQRESPSSLKMDYFEANRILMDFLKTSRHKLLETLAHDIATLLLNRFDVEAIGVTITKFPLNMPNVEGVSYSCRRYKTH